MFQLLISYVLFVVVNVLLKFFFCCQWCCYLSLFFVSIVFSVFCIRCFSYPLQLFFLGVNVDDAIVAVVVFLF